MAIIPTKDAVKDPTAISTIWAIIDALAAHDVDISLISARIKNGGFDVWDSGDPVAWDAAALSGGSYAEDVAVSYEGDTSFKGTTTIGGGYVTLSSNFFAVGYLERIDLGLMYLSSAATQQLKVTAAYYDEDQVVVSSVDLVSLTSGLSTAWDGLYFQLVPPSTARYARVIITIGDTTGSASVAGTVNLDQIRAGIGSTKGRAFDTSLNPISFTVVATTSTVDTYLNIKDEITEIRPIRSALVRIQTTHDYDSGSLRTWDPETQAWVSLVNLNGGPIDETLLVMCDPTGHFRLNQRDDPAEGTTTITVIEYDVV